MTILRNLNRNHCRGGFTAVELVVSMVLASLLMIALMGIVRGLDVKTKALVGKRVKPAWQSVLDRVLRHDFENATEIEHVGNSFVLRGYGGKSASNGLANWTRAEITYELVPSPGGAWLVRREQLGAAAPGSETPVNFVLGGVTGFRIQVAGAAANVSLGQAIDSTFEEAIPIEGSIGLSVFDQPNSEPFYEYEYRAW